MMSSEGPIENSRGRKAVDRLQIQIERRRCGTRFCAGPMDIILLILQGPRPYGRGYSLPAFQASFLIVLQHS